MWRVLLQKNGFVTCLSVRVRVGFLAQASTEEVKEDEHNNHDTIRA